MKIHIKSDNFRFTLPIPTNLVFNNATVHIAVWAMKNNGNDSFAALSPASLKRLFAEFRRIKRKHGQWTLVEVRSAGGEEVTITL